MCMCVCLCVFARTCVCVGACPHVLYLPFFPVHNPVGCYVFCRFRHDNSSARLVYNRFHGDGQKMRLNKALDCRAHSPAAQTGPVGGFFKHSPYTNNGRRVPASGCYTITGLTTSADYNGISELHAGSNVWLDLWNGGSGVLSKLPNRLSRGCRRKVHCRRVLPGPASMVDVSIK